MAGVGAVDARVGQVEEGFPPVGAALGTGLGGISGQQRLRGGHVADGGGGVDGGRRQLGVLGQQGPGSLGPGRVVSAVGEAGEPEELVDQLGLVADGAADRLEMGVAGQPVDGLDVSAQLGPRREPVGAGQGELHVGPGQPGRLRGACSEVGEAGVELAHQVDGARLALADQTLEGLGQVAKLLDVGVAGQRTDRHGGLLPVTPAVRIARLERRFRGSTS